MKLVENIIKAAAAVAFVAGIAYLVVKYMDAIKAWFDKICQTCDLSEDDFDFEDDFQTEFTFTKDFPDEEPAPAAEGDAPVADAADFEA